MKKEENIQPNDVVIKRSTALTIAAVCMAAGFLAGVFYSTGFGGSRQVRKMTEKQSTSQAQSPTAAAPQSEVVSALETNVAANPQDAEAWVRLGDGYFDNNDPANAIRAYKKSLELKPGNANVLTDMGVMYRSQGNAQEALRCFEQAIAADPKHRQSRYNKGIVLMHDLQNPEAAVQAWEELVSIYPDAKTQEGTLVSDMIKNFRSSSPQGK